SGNVTIGRFGSRGSGITTTGGLRSGGVKPGSIGRDGGVTMRGGSISTGGLTAGGSSARLSGFGDWPGGGGGVDLIGMICFCTGCATGHCCGGRLMLITTLLISMFQFQNQAPKKHGFQGGNTLTSMSTMLITSGGGSTKIAMP